MESNQIIGVFGLYSCWNVLCSYFKGPLSNIWLHQLVPFFSTAASEHFSVQNSSPEACSCKYFWLRFYFTEIIAVYDSFLHSCIALIYFTPVLDVR